MAGAVSQGVVVGSRGSSRSATSSPISRAASTISASKAYLRRSGLMLLIGLNVLRPRAHRLLPE
jgi:hypothetical protein